MYINNFRSIKDSCVSRPCLEEHVTPSVPVVINIHGNSYKEIRAFKYTDKLVQSSKYILTNEFNLLTNELTLRVAALIL